MAGIMTTQGNPDLLDLRMEEIKDGVMAQVEDKVSKFYTEKTPVQLTNRGSSMVPMNGTWLAFNGSLTSAYDSPEQGYSWQFDNVEYAKATQIERALLEFSNNEVINEKFRGLIDTGVKFNQSQAAALFNNAFSVDTSFNYSNDEALALCSASHTTVRTDVSTASGFSNYSTASLSPTTMRADYATFRKFRDLAANYIGNHQATALVLPVDHKLRAEEIMKTMKGLDAATGNYNVLQDRFEVIDWIFITSTKNWFLVNLEMMKRNCYHYVKVKPEYARIEEFETIVAKYRGYMFHSYGRTAVWQHTLGHEVT